MNKEETLTARIRGRIEDCGNQITEDDFQDLKKIVAEDIREFRNHKETAEALATFYICIIRNQLGHRATDRKAGASIKPEAANLDEFRKIMGYKKKDIDDNIAVFKHLVKLMNEAYPGATIMVPDEDNVLSIKSVEEIIDRVVNGD